MPADPHEAQNKHAGIRTLRRYHEGTIAFNERRSPSMFIAEAATGAIVLPAEAGMTRAEELTLYAPEESAWVMQIALVPVLIERPESEEAVDRWAAYHGRSASKSWIRCSIDGAKTESMVYGPEALMLPNALGAAEFKLIKKLNADQEGLARACRVHGPIEVADPVAVGVDPFGVDVRARFGIVRLEFPEGVEAKTVAQADQSIAWLLGGNPAAQAGRAT